MAENTQQSGDESFTTKLLLGRLIPLLQEKGPQFDAIAGSNQYGQELARIARENLLRELAGPCTYPETIQDLKNMLNTYTETLKMIRNNNDIFDDTTTY